MPLKAAAKLAQGGQLFYGEVATLGESSIEDRGSVSLAEDEAVTLRPAGVAGVMPEHPEIEGAQNLDGR